MARPRKLKRAKGKSGKAAKPASPRPKRRPAKRPPPPKKSRKLSPRKPSQAAQKSKATRAAKQQALEAQRFSKAAAKRYGRHSETARRVREAADVARRWALEASKAKTLSAKRKARAKATKARNATANTFKAATRETTRGQARRSGWSEVGRATPSTSERDTFTSYEHARSGASSVLSLLESRPGVVGVLAYRRVSQVERGSAGGLTRSGELSAELRERARDVGRELGFTATQQRELEELLVEAELYGVELELEVENYREEAA